MRLFRSVIAAGLAKKLFDEARKPENQRRAREAYGRVRDRKQGRRAP
jgi:hypothetical protein